VRSHAPRSPAVGDLDTDLRADEVVLVGLRLPGGRGAGGQGLSHRTFLVPHRVEDDERPRRGDRAL